jgi:transposase
MSSDEDLLIELQTLCGQSLEASYRRKLEAIALLLQRRPQRDIEHCAGASLRTVQRWAKRARRFGAGALQDHTRSTWSSKLSEEQRARLAADLKQPPSFPGCAARCWTAGLLMRHLRENYAATFSLRHCRRLLTIDQAKRPARTAFTARPRISTRTTADHQASTTADRQELFAPQRMGDYGRKRQGLARIKRLASAGMPLQPLVYSLFDFVRDAVPCDEVSPGLAATSGEGARWIVRDFDYGRWFPHMQRYLLEASPELSGFRPPSLLPQNSRIVLRHDEIVCPNYYRSEGYNEFFRYMGMHHGLLTLLRDEHGQFLGYYPVFRSERMEAFTADDVQFFKAAAAYIALGVSTAALITSRFTEEDAFEPFGQVPGGVVVMDREGKESIRSCGAAVAGRQFRSDNLSA